MDALLNFEGSYWFGGIGGFVNVSRHCDNLHVNGLGAFSFGKREIHRGRITLGDGYLFPRARVRKQEALESMLLAQPARPGRRGGRRLLLAKTFGVRSSEFGV